MQLRGENYLIGLEARLRSEDEFSSETIPLNSILSAMERRAAISLVFVDACRDNPLAERLQLQISGAVRGQVVRGLAPLVSASSGTMVAFSALPGQVAYDGKGLNSPFATALIQHLAEPGAEIGTAFKKVTRAVRNATGGRQSPQLISSLDTEVYISPLAREEKAVTVEVPAETQKPRLRIGADPVPEDAERLAGLPQASDPAGMRGLPLARQDKDSFGHAARLATIRGWDRFLQLHPESGLIQSASAERAKVIAGFQRMRPPQQREAALALTKEQTKQVQQTLVGLGFPLANPNGTLNARGRRQISAFQASRGLPKTGFLDGELLALPEFRSISTAAPALVDPARKLALEDVSALETDSRILRAVECYQDSEITYGEFDGHVYVAVYRPFIAWKLANRLATGCGGYLVTIRSAAENAFVYDLIRDDSKMFQNDFDGAFTTKQGPWIGLVQDQSGAEPRGGWSWSNGESLEFENWLPGQPDGIYSDDDYAILYTQRRGKSKDADMEASFWDDRGIASRVRGFIAEFE